MLRADLAIAPTARSSDEWHSGGLMRILQLSLKINHVIIADLAEQITEGGHQTHLLIWGEGRLLAERLKDAVTVLPGSDTAAPGVIAEAQAFSGSWRPDVVLYHDPWSETLVGALQRERPVVGFVHNLTCPGQRLFRRGDRQCMRTMDWGCVAHWYTGPCGSNPNPARAVAALRTHMRHRALLQYLPHVLVASDFMRGHLITEGVNAQQITVVDTDCGESAWRPAVTARTARPLVICVGRIIHQKGIHHLLRALAEPNLSEIDVAIIGDGYFRAPLVEMARSMGLGNVIFPGWMHGPDLDDWYRRADLLVVPSVWPEPFGAVVREAARYGVRAVVSDRGGLKEWPSMLPGTVTVDVTNHRRFAEEIHRAVGDGRNPVGRPLLRSRDPARPSVANALLGGKAAVL